jgi:hypothetical protein
LGAWGNGSFDNDAAMDWLLDLTDRDDLELVRDALAAAAGPPTFYLDADLASEAVAAAEVVAIAAGAPGDHVRGELETWLAGHGARVDRALVEQALDSLRRVRADSELRELNAHDGGWLDETGALETRLERALTGMT